MQNTYLTPSSDVPEIVHLNTHDFYDIPLTGLCSVGVERLWFQLCSPWEEDPPLYELVKVSEEFLIDYDARVELFDALMSSTDSSKEIAASFKIFKEQYPQDIEILEGTVIMTVPYSAITWNRTGG